MMVTSAKGLDLIKKYEGFRSQKYLCPAGKWTIGYGHVLKQDENFDNITVLQGEELLITDIAPCERTIHNNVIAKLIQCQFDALVSLIYNWGSGNFTSSTLIKKLNILDHNACVEVWQTIVKSKGITLPGLVKRRSEEIQLFLSGS